MNHKKAWRYTLPFNLIMAVADESKQKKESKATLYSIWNISRQMERDSRI